MDYYASLDEAAFSKFHLLSIIAKDRFNIGSTYLCENYSQC